MFWEVAPYLLLLTAGVVIAVLLTSKKLLEKMVAAGMLPRTLPGFLPILQTVIRTFGVVLIGAGLFKIGADNGWINRELLSRYAFSTLIILLGVILLFASRREH